MEMSLLVGFWGVSFLLIMTPGADWAYAISAGIHGRGVIPAVIGLMSGHLLATAVVVAGTGALVAGHPVLLSIITLPGALYLFWLGTRMLRHPATIVAGTSQTASHWNRWAVKGLCVSGLNPKVFLLFLALLPQFTDPQGHWSVPLQMSVLALLHLITCTAIYLLVGLGSKRVLATHPQAARIVSRVSGGMMIAISLCLLVEQLLH